MNRLISKQRLAERRRRRTRAKLHGTADRPRLSVHFSNLHVTAQLIDDELQTTLAYVTTVGAKTSGSQSQKAAWVGSQIAKKAASRKVKKVIFDRGAHLYHGRVKALAEAARQAGLEF